MFVCQFNFNGSFPRGEIISKLIRVDYFDVREKRQRNLFVYIILEQWLLKPKQHEKRELKLLQRKANKKHRGSYNFDNNRTVSVSKLSNEFLFLKSIKRCGWCNNAITNSITTSIFTNTNNDCIGEEFDHRFSNSGNDADD